MQLTLMLSGPFLYIMEPLVYYSEYNTWGESFWINNFSEFTESMYMCMQWVDEKCGGRNPFEKTHYEVVGKGYWSEEGFGMTINIYT